jgi:hypothetical protein
VTEWTADAYDRLMSDFPIAPEDLTAEWLADAVGVAVDEISLGSIEGGFWSRIV